MKMLLINTIFKNILGFLILQIKAIIAQGNVVQK